MKATLRRCYNRLNEWKPQLLRKVREVWQQNDIPEKHATSINTDGGVRLCHVAQCLLPGNIHIDAVCPDTTLLLFHYNNIQSPQCAGWRCGTMPSLTKPDRDKNAKIRCSAHMHPEKTTRISFPNKRDFTNTTATQLRRFTNCFPQ